MLTPQGLKGKQFRITGRSHPRLGPPPRRRRKVLMLIGSLLALSMIALGGVQVVDIFTGKGKHAVASACASGKASVSGKPLAAPVLVSGPPSASSTASAGGAASASAAGRNSPAASATGRSSAAASGSAAPASSAAPVTGPPLPASTAIPQPQAVTVNVYNATDKSGLAARTADELKQRGFTIGKVGNAPSALDKKVPGSVQLISGPAGAGAATLLGAQVAGSATMTDSRTDATVDFVIGDGYNALLDPNAAAAALADATKAKPTGGQSPGSC
ncbi:LytR C-terminal domain-containing protein [Kitasatospora sp. NPDC052896]|uniref:LytR C-terminal domain-containing protein n=1 Tax=Kitasatospora sp. NPDC052896 TaxID=3364061 RepID=UPI0037C94FDC